MNDSDTGCTIATLGYSVDEIATLYDLTLPKSIQPWPNYYDHREEINRSIGQDDAFAEPLRA
jgi:hypothetical protein